MRLFRIVNFATFGVSNIFRKKPLVVSALIRAIHSFSPNVGKTDGNPKLFKPVTFETPPIRDSLRMRIPRLHAPTA
jgi:hypothetical protein